MENLKREKDASTTLSVEVSSHGALTILTLAGELDLFSAPKLRQQLVEVIDADHHHVVLNLEEVSFMDSTGLGVLIGGLRRVREHDGEISLVCTGRPVLRVLTITGLHNIFAIYDTLEDATTAQDAREAKTT